ncbi:hypothetical protein FB45DRAFT_1086535 [Roridomyces roridus]|uniref:Uncharacterized protein n=1 Tax=Roridomyces roridus TaxID=1738132 RepID=A0AAD7BLW2_9AGAR|nr:hypothetical protein FB45DRAFT_1086535 [Roridomyces roridus]
MQMEKGFDLYKNKELQMELLAYDPIEAAQQFYQERFGGNEVIPELSTADLEFTNGFISKSAAAPPRQTSRPSCIPSTPASRQPCSKSAVSTFLRNEGLLYGKILKREGVKTRGHTYPGVPHGFTYILPNIAAAKRWEREYREGSSGKASFGILPPITGNRSTHSLLLIGVCGLWAHSGGKGKEGKKCKKWMHSIPNDSGDPFTVLEVSQSIDFMYMSAIKKQIINFDY